MTEITVDNDVCDVEIREFGEHQKEKFIGYYGRVSFSTDINNIKIYGYNFKPRLLTKYKKYSFHISRTCENPESDIHYYIERYLIQNTKDMMKIHYEKFQLLANSDFTVEIQKPLGTYFGNTPEQCKEMEEFRKIKEKIKNTNVIT